GPPPRQLPFLLAREQGNSPDLLQVDSEVLAAGRSRLLADVVVDFVDERVERLVGDVRLLTHAASWRSRPPGRCAAASAAGRAGCRRGRGGGTPKGRGRAVGGP